MSPPQARRAARGGRASAAGTEARSGRVVGLKPDRVQYPSRETFAFSSPLSGVVLDLPPIRSRGEVLSKTKGLMRPSRARDDERASAHCVPVRTPAAPRRRPPPTRHARTRSYGAIGGAPAPRVDRRLRRRLQQRESAWDDATAAKLAVTWGFRGRGKTSTSKADPWPAARYRAS